MERLNIDLNSDPVALREKLHVMHQDMESLEKRIGRVSRAAKNLQKAYATMAVAAQEFQQTMASFADGKEGSIMTSFSQVLDKVNKSDANLGERLSPIIVDALQRFLDNEVHVGLDLHVKMVRARDVYDKAARSKKKDADLDEKKREFDEANVKYVQKLIDVETKKEFELMDIFTNWMVCSLTHHKRAWKLLDELQPMIKQYKKQILMEAKGYNAEEETRAMAVKESLAHRASDSEIQGYLTNLSVMGRPRRWWAVANGMLAQYRNYSDFSPIESFDLLLFTVKPVADDPAAFCLVSPSDNFTLQASSVEEKGQWVLAISTSIGKQLNSQGTGNSETARSSTNDPAHPLQQMRRGNTSFLKCVDCGARDPDWGAINLGIMFCINCSGIHRNMGVHISQVRSLTLDVDVWDEDLMRMMKGIGNETSNSVWEASYKGAPPKPTATSDMKQREAYILAKYRDRSFLNTSATPSEGLLELCSQAEAPDVSDVLRLIASGANLDEENELGLTSLHYLVQGTESMVVLELLLRNGASVNARDQHGDTPLHIAVRAKLGRVATVLLRHGADPDVENEEGETPRLLAEQLGVVLANTTTTTKPSSPGSSRRSQDDVSSGGLSARKPRKQPLTTLSRSSAGAPPTSPITESRQRTWTGASAPSARAQAFVARTSNPPVKPSQQPLATSPPPLTSITSTLDRSLDRSLDRPRSPPPPLDLSGDGAGSPRSAAGSPVHRSPASPRSARPPPPIEDPSPRTWVAASHPKKSLPQPPPRSPRAPNRPLPQVESDDDDETY